MYKKRSVGIHAIDHEVCEVTELLWLRVALFGRLALRRNSDDQPIQLERRYVNRTAKQAERIGVGNKVLDGDEGRLVRGVAIRQYEIVGADAEYRHQRHMQIM